jgi:hypothetical protein
VIKSPIAVLSLLIPAVVAIYVCGAVGVWYVWMGTIGKSSEITISLNFTAEHAENAEACGWLWSLWCGCGAMARGVDKSSCAMRVS